MSSRSIFFTGYPGFIGRWLVRDLLANDPEARFTFLVQEKFRGRAQEDIASLVAEGHAAEGQLKAEAGDITDAKLGLDGGRYEQAASHATEVWHLAGAFDLNVPEGLARRVNYWGVRHIVAFCKACPHLSHLVHFSSVVVHAERTDFILEDELDEGQDLVNPYFSTKFWGEMEVRRAMQEDGLRAVIIRPAGVHGDSRTGETDKFDNVYLTFPLAEAARILRLPAVNFGRGEARPNFVPVDFLTAAAAAIGSNTAAIGKCFHIVDPDPPTSREQTQMVWRTVLGREAYLTIPTPLLDWTTRHMAWAYKMLNVPPDSITYLNHVGTFDDTNTRALLEGTGITCPRYQDYLPRLYAWWKANRGREGMKPKM